MSLAFPIQLKYDIFQNNNPYKNFYNFYSKNYINIYDLYTDFTNYLTYGNDSWDYYYCQYNLDDISFSNGVYTNDGNKNYKSSYQVFFIFL